MKKVAIITAVIALILGGCGKAEPAETTEIFFTAPSIQVTESPETTAATEGATMAAEEETQPPETETVPEETEPVGETGTVAARSLNIRESPSVSASKVGALKYGEVVTVLEKELVNGMFWGRIDRGWISMDYIRLGGEPTPPQVPEHFLPQAHSEQGIPPAVPASPVVPESEAKPDPQPEEHQVSPEAAGPELPPKAEVPAPTQPAVCQHQWVPIQNIPAEYSYRYFVVCSCGAAFADADEWAAHRDGYLGTEDLVNHTGYASSSEKTETSPSMTVWQCSQCGVSKTINSLENP